MREGSPGARGKSTQAKRALQRSAEIAFRVQEDFHGQGIAGHLLNHLIHIAREKGWSQFAAEVLPQNKAMLAVFARSGLPMRQRPGDDAIHVTLSLTFSGDGA